MILGNCLGEICVGDDENKAVKALRGRTFVVLDLNLEGSYSPTIRVYYGSSHFDVELYKDKVWRINNYSEAIKNKDGIGPGMPIRKLFESYTLDQLGYAEGMVGFVFHETPAYSYLVEDGDIPERFWTYEPPGAGVVFRIPAMESNQSPEPYLDLDVPIKSIIITKY